MLLPVKRLDRVKVRLAGLLSQDERRLLALAMLRDVVGAVSGAGFGASVLSPDADVLALAGTLGARPSPQRPGVRSLNRAIEAELVATDADAALVILPDTPLVTADEIAQLAGEPCPGEVPGPARPRVSVAPDRRGIGTNALVLRPPSAIPPRFGRGSFARHVQAATERGIETRVHSLPGLGLDIDGPEDIRDFLRVDSETDTRRLLAEWGMAARLAALGRTP